MQQLPGIGPFCSAIVVARALGHKDYVAGTITELNTTVAGSTDSAAPPRHA